MKYCSLEWRCWLRLHRHCRKCAVLDVLLLDAGWKHFSGLVNVVSAYTSRISWCNRGWLGWTVHKGLQVQWGTSVCGIRGGSELCWCEGANLSQSFEEVWPFRIEHIPVVQLMLLEVCVILVLKWRRRGLIHMDLSYPESLGRCLEVRAASGICWRWVDISMHLILSRFLLVLW